MACVLTYSSCPARRGRESDRIARADRLAGLDQADAVAPDPRGAECRPSPSLEASYFIGAPYIFARFHAGTETNRSQPFFL